MYGWKLVNFKRHISWLAKCACRNGGFLKTGNKEKKQKMDAWPKD